VTGPARDPALRAVPYGAGDAPAWDAFVAQSCNGNWLHGRRFLDYHGTRFDDRSLSFVDEAGNLVGLLPAALDPADPQCVVSHPGATYGGFVLSSRRLGHEVFPLLDAARAHYAAAGLRRLRYRSMPLHLQARSSQQDAYALWRAGARLFRRDLWSTIDLRQPRQVDADRRRHLRRGAEQGLSLARETTPGAYADFHRLLVACLDERHAAAPVHPLAEMLELQSRLGDGIELWLARDRNGACVAGEWMFVFAGAMHGQYGVADAAGRAASAQDLLLETLVRSAATRGLAWFSFGTSTEQGGQRLNDSLLRYKASFGAGAVVQDFYELDLGAGR
jgi:hypothetical protein